jgi:peptidylprolyl isomerase
MFVIRSLFLTTLLAGAYALAADVPPSAETAPSEPPAAATPAPVPPPTPVTAPSVPKQAAAKPAAPAKAGGRSVSLKELLATSKPAEWAPLEPEHTLYMELASGRVIIELAPQFAPKHVASIEKLAKSHWYDGLAINRVQDNFVVQWGDPLGGKPEGADKRLPPEFTRSGPLRGFVRLKDTDTYVSETGFAEGFPVGRSDPGGESWLLHCYGMVGVGRDNDPATAIGAELYAVIGQAPRQLDRNVALVGRVVWGMELLSALPRGTGELGFYDQPEQRVPIERVRLASDVPAAERINLEALRTDSVTFSKVIENRRNRSDAWYKVPAGRIDVCNVPLPVRVRADVRKKP